VLRYTHRMTTQKAESFLGIRAFFEFLGAAALSASLGALLIYEPFIRRVTGLVPDWLSWITASFDSLGILAGVWFGIFTGSVLMSNFRLGSDRWRFVLWTILSGASYLIAWAVCFEIIAHRVFSAEGKYEFDGSPGLPIDYALAGLVGAAILSVAYHFLYQKLGRFHHLVIISIGALSAYFISFIFWSVTTADSWHLFLFNLHLIWQLAVAATIAVAFLLDRR
jgi:hypothetical protein